jgi:DNA-binding CsgD family transcriptional regulator
VASATGTTLKADPALSIIAGILRVAPATRWAFARVEADGALSHLVASDDAAGELSRLRAELKRQRKKVRSGPNVAPSLEAIGSYVSGITLLFANSRRTFGILSLVRNAELGPFTPAELNILGFALPSICEQYTAALMETSHGGYTLRKQAPERRRAPEFTDTGFYVLDRELNVVFSWISGHQHAVAAIAHLERLPAAIEDAVRDLTASWIVDGGPPKDGVSHAVPFLEVRTQPLSGPAGVCVGVRIARRKPRNSLATAVARFEISPREEQVLRLLLEGRQIEEIGRQLHISISTVQDHVKSMVERTGSRSRTEMIARVLGWESEPIATSAKR